MSVISREAIAEVIRDFVIMILDYPPETVREIDAFYDDLGFDSLDMMELTMSLEEEFNIEITDDEAEHLQTVRQAIDFVHNRLSQRVYA